MDYVKLKLLGRAALLVVAAAFVWGFLVPTLVSGNDFSVLMGIGSGIFLTLAMILYAFRLLEEFRVAIAEEEK